MQEYPVMKKAQEKALVKGFEPIFMLVGVLFLMFSIVGLFAGGPSFIKLIAILIVDLIALLAMKFLSRDIVKKKKFNAFLFPINITIKDK
jgi:hypothetical protein